MWVVKLGGSLAGSPGLSRWLAALAQTDAIIVPGGGPFADTVRATQARWNFSDQAAHAMAILAMRQYGLMLSDLANLKAASTLEACACQRNRAMLWLPLPESLQKAGIAASWEITSDSLAAWLAGQLGASHLLLVKSATITPPPSGEFSCEQLATTGVLDPAFPEFSRLASFRCWLSGPDDHVRLPAGFEAPKQNFISVSHELAESRR